MGDNHIGWKSKKQTIVCLSSAKAKYRTIRKVGELVWLERLLTELTEPCSLPITVFYDIQPAIYIAKNPVFHERTKYIEVDCHFVRNKLKKELITPQRIPTTKQLANILNKALSGPKHSHFWASC